MKELFFYFKKHKLISFTVIILVASLFTLTGYIKKLRSDIYNLKSAYYQKSFFDLSSSLSNINTNLSKLLITSDTKQLNILANEIEKETVLARKCIGDLPRKDTNIENSQKFIAQLSDFIIELTRKTKNNTPFNQEEEKILLTLYDYSDKLSSSISDMENKFLTGELNFEKTVSSPPDDKIANLHLEVIEKQFENYPQLIYDGPFSDHITASYKFLENEPVITKKTAEIKAVDFLSFKNINTLKNNSDSVSDSGVYGFFTDNIFIDVTKKGGYIMSFCDTRIVESDTISFTQAIQKASDFLSSKGFNYFYPDFYEKFNNVITISFFPKENGITIYPDIIKIKVACDNGDIVGADFNNYLENNHKRTNLNPVISKEEAKKLLNEDFIISSERLCVIPEYKSKEILCYEFYGQFDNKEYLCYINADNGETEKIFLITKDKNKILVI